MPRTHVSLPPRHTAEQDAPRPSRLGLSGVFLGCPAQSQSAGWGWRESGLELVPMWAGGRPSPVAPCGRSGPVTPRERRRAPSQREPKVGSQHHTASTSSSTESAHVVILSRHLRSNLPAPARLSPTPTSPDLHHLSASRIAEPGAERHRNRTSAASAARANECIQSPHLASRRLASPSFQFFDRCSHARLID